MHDRQDDCHHREGNMAQHGFNLVLPYNGLQETVDRKLLTVKERYSHE
jgi:hypothetical protein